jgi:hypothetical protein
VEQNVEKAGGGEEKGEGVGLGKGGEDEGM